LARKAVPLIPKKQSKPILRFRYLQIAKKDREAPYLVREFVRCGKPICRCNEGLRNGPYSYLRYGEWDAEARMDRYRREYVPTRRPIDGGGLSGLACRSSWPARTTREAAADVHCDSGSWLLGRPASESGTLFQGDGGYE
jgi:hypothetical protein